MDARHRKLWMAQAVIWEQRASEEATLMVTIDHAHGRKPDDDLPNESVL